MCRMSIGVVWRKAYGESHAGSLIEDPAFVRRRIDKSGLVEAEKEGELDAHIEGSGRVP